MPGLRISRERVLMDGTGPDMSGPYGHPTISLL